MASTTTRMTTTLADTLQDSPVLVACLAVAASVLLYQLFSPPATLYRQGSKQNIVRSWPFAGLGAMDSHSQRWNFLVSNLGQPFEKRDGKSWTAKATRLNLRNHILTISGGQDDAKTFFYNPGMNFNDGYGVMYAGAPSAPKWLKWIKSRGQSSVEGDEAAEDDATKAHNFFFTHTRLATSPKRLQELLPEMISYCIDSFGRLGGPSGKIDTHDTIYKLIFRISIRTIGCNEHARDEERMKRISDPFWQFQANTGYFATHFPFLPFPSTVRKWMGAIQLGQEMSSTIKARRVENRTEDDYVQTLMDQGCTAMEITNFVIGLLFAAIINSTGMMAYTLLFAGTRPDITARLRSEIDAVLRDEIKKEGEDYDKVRVCRCSRVPVL